MIRLNPFAFYELGAALKPLRDMSDSVDLGDEFFVLATARGQVKKALENKEVSLGTCRPAAEKLGEAIQVPISRLFEHYKKYSETPEADTPPVGTLHFSEVSRIQNALRDFEPILAAELLEKPTYIVLKKGIFSTTDLIERADGIFSDTLPLSDATRREIKEAGRCLAFELWTATAFHVFRATETVIVEYYEALTKGGSPLKDSDRNWGKYIKLLSDHGADTRIVEYLSYFKDNHRNPVTHPEETLDSDQAIALLLAAPNAIVPLVRETEALRALAAVVAVPAPVAVAVP